MKVAGILFCISSVVSAAATEVLRRTMGGSPGDTVAAQAVNFGGALLVLLLGLALIQGVNGVRIFVLIVTALGALVAVAMAAVLGSVRELQFLAAAMLLTTVGYFVLLLTREASAARAVISVILIVAGAGASVVAQVWLAGFGQRAFGEELRKVATDQRVYDDPAAGLTIAVPEGWVILSDDAEIYEGVPSRVILGDPDAGTVAFVNYERKPPGLLSLDHYLDQVLDRMNETGLAATQTDRTDVDVGKAAARRMSLTWRANEISFSGFVSVWLDGDTIFLLHGSSPSGWSSRTEERFAALEGALRFTAPVETALTDAQARLTAECPVFTPTSVRTIGRKIPPDSATETYFRVGWSWAVGGQGQLDPEASAELGQLMRAVFSAMPEGERRDLGRYTEKLRSRQPTTRGEDAAAMRTLGRAAQRLPVHSLERLQALVEISLTVGALL